MGAWNKWGDWKILNKRGGWKILNKRGEWNNETLCPKILAE